MDLLNILPVITLLLYAMSSVLLLSAVIFHLERVLTIGFIVSMIGLAAHVIGAVMRWLEVGHGPYLGFSDSVSSFALLSVAAFALLVWWKPSLKILGSLVMPIAFALMSASLMAPASDTSITVALASVWLGIHVFFANCSYVALFLSFVLAVLTLLRSRGIGKDSKLFARLPGDSVIDDLIFRFVALGFILWTLMILTGAVWANEAWGRYWGWDPIETWSLIVWILYALILHLRLTLGWKGKRFAVLAAVAMPIMLFSLIGVPFLWNSIHAAYLNFG
ncbi:MAG: cytochrome c biogenesis protein CcsA [Coriobacteriia bacterium]|nr:cytochrome c biogenesis protein CcsA [Coriobacteriia bacterium]